MERTHCYSNEIGLIPTADGQGIVHSCRLTNRRRLAVKSGTILPTTARSGCPIVIAVNTQMDTATVNTKRKQNVPSLRHCHRLSHRLYPIVLKCSFFSFEPGHFINHVRGAHFPAPTTIKIVFYTYSFNSIAFLLKACCWPHIFVYVYLFFSFYFRLQKKKTLK